MKLESINFWLIVLRNSVSHCVCQIMDLGTRCFHPPPWIKLLSKFIVWATKFFFEFFRKNQIRKFFGPKTSLLGIKSIHGRPDSPSWYTDSWPYIVPPTVEPHCQLPSLLVHWSYRERNNHAMQYKSMEVYAD